MPNALDQFTYEKWEAAKVVLSGQSDEGVSFTAAARAAGVSVAVLRAWVNRSRQRHPGDSPTFHAIAEFYDTIKQLQGEVIEDDLWQIARKGHKMPTIDKGHIVDHYYKKDPSLMMKLLKVRDPKYEDKSAGVTIKLDASEVFRRLIAGKRIAEARQEALEAEQDEKGAFQVPKIPESDGQ